MQNRPIPLIQKGLRKRLEFNRIEDMLNITVVK